MSFEKFLNAIDRSWVGHAVSKRLDLIRRTDPRHIFVENVRAFFGLPDLTARVLCELAVKEGIFEKQIGYRCPNDDRVIRYFESDESVPVTLTCRVCEAFDEERGSVFPTADLKTIESYRLAGESSQQSVAHSHE